MASPEKKVKKDKSEKRKRARDEADGDGAATPDGQRRHKKSKSVTNGDLPTPQPTASEETSATKLKKKKKDKGNDGGEPKKKKKKDKGNDEGEPKKKHRSVTDTVVAEELQDSQTSPKKHKKTKKVAVDIDDGAVIPETDDDEAGKKQRKKEKKAKRQASMAPPPLPSADAEADAMDVDEAAKPAPAQKSSSHVYQPPDIPANPRFPFFTQTVSLYEPLYPSGWAQPVTSCEEQHLKHLHNRYVPSLRGVLLDYRNVTLGSDPGRGRHVASMASKDDDPCTLMARNENAMGFGWVTADVDLFVPSRGAWMEGSVNLQTEGHIGVVCFGRFNASIEARRLPRDWRWVATESSDADGSGAGDTASIITGGVADEHGVMRQVHSTGYWADVDGQRVKGRIRFRIRNFDVGVSGEVSYLSLEGTMLDHEGERAAVREEAEAAKDRKAHRRGGSAAMMSARRMRRAPEFSMTRFEEDKEPGELGAEEPLTTAQQADAVAGDVAAAEKSKGEAPTAPTEVVEGGVGEDEDEGDTD